MTTPLLLSIFPTFAVGGAQSRFTTLANYLGPSWRHAIVAMDGVETARERFDAGIHVTFPPVDIQKGDLLGNVKRFRGIIAELNPATVLTHNFGSIEWAMSNRFPKIHHVHAEDGFGPEERDRQLRRRIVIRRIFLHHRAIILPSQNLMRIARDVWRFDKRHLHHIPNGIDLARFSAAISGAHRSGDGPVVGTVAALRPEKNVARLIRAFHLATMKTSARLVIVGDGPLRGELQSLAESLDLRDRVFLAGHIARPEALMESFDVFAMSSDTEQMPISLLEAMSAGLPTAATDVGDIAHMVPDVGRPFITPCDDHALAAAIGALLKDPALRAKLGRASRLKAEQNFDQSDMFRRWASMLDPGMANVEARSR